MRHYLKNVFDSRTMILCLSLLLASMSKAQQKSDIQDLLIIKDKIEKLQKPLPKPRPNDWLSLHYEEGQTFDAYRNFKNPLKTEQRIIYLKQIGNFDEDEERIFLWVKKYLELFFQTQVGILNQQNLDSIPSQYQRERFGHIQVMTPHIFSFLPNSTQENELAYLALTNVDIYPNNSMNFVFGQADYSTRIGATSMFQLKVVKNDSINVLQSAIKIAKTASHEIGHMLGINHCTAFACLMNGANNNEEADRQPMHFCSECSAKLIWYLDLDFAKRSKELQSFWKRQEMIEIESYYRKAQKI